MLSISGVEFTQGIQYFGSGYLVCGPANARVACPDNSLPLIANKPTVARLYLGGSTSALNLGASARLMRPNSTSPVRFGRGTASATIVGSANRSTAQSTLNVTLSPTIPPGDYDVQIEVFDVDRPGSQPLATYTDRLTFHCRNCVRIRLVRARYTGRGLNIPAPTLSRFWAMAEPMFRQWIPSPRICLVRDSVEVFDGRFSTRWDSTDPAENGTTGTLWKILQRLRQAESLPADTIYLALYPDGANSNGGAAVQHDGIAPDVIPWIMIHEIGHCLGLGHAPTGDYPDPQFPVYGANHIGSIGEVGFDPIPGTVYGPQHTDFMGYQAPFWVSPYHHSKLFDLIGPCPPDAPLTPFPFNKVPVFSCSYSLGLPSIEILRKICGPKTTQRFPFPSRSPPFKFAGTFRANLFDASGGLLFTEEYFAATMFPDAPSATLTVYVPALEDAYRLVVQNEDLVLEDSVLDKEGPRLQAEAMLRGRRYPKILVRWRVGSVENVPISVRASTDGGESWSAFNIKLGATSIEIDPRTLPVGDSCMVEVLAGARLATTTWRSEPLEVGTGTKQITLLSVPSRKVYQGEPIYLAAALPFGAEPDDLEWRSNRDGLVATGDLVLLELSPGRHKIELRHALWDFSRKVGTIEVLKRPRSRKGRDELN